MVCYHTDGGIEQSVARLVIQSSFRQLEGDVCWLLLFQDGFLYFIICGFSWHNKNDLLISLIFLKLMRNLYTKRDHEC